ncbi:hypothetical protein BS47DRAFT_1253890, partial [Hydnum rufescens UP504]
WTNDVLVLHIERVKKQLGLPVAQKAILVIDSWSVHIGKDYCEWMRQEHIHIKINYIPAGCTGKVQPADVGLQHVIKHHIWGQCLEFLAAVVESEIKAGWNATEISLPDGLEQLQNESANWITSVLH